MHKKTSGSAITSRNIQQSDFKVTNIFQHSKEH